MTTEAGRALPLTAEDERRLRRHVATEPWQLPDRIHTIAGLVERLLATLDAERQAVENERRRLYEAVERGEVEVINAYGQWDESRDTLHRWVRLDLLAPPAEKEQT